MLRRTLLGLFLVLVLLGAGGVAVAGGSPRLSTSGPVSVAGTEASAVFTIADRTVRQVRYADRGTLRYSFSLTNEGRLPVEIQGLAERQPSARLFTYRSLSGPDGEAKTSLAAGESASFTLALFMSGCETLSARAGSFVSEVVVRTARAGVFADEVRVTLPEEIHTGSPREAFCPRSTATSRPPG